MLGWVVKWKTTFREYSGVVVEWVVDDAEAKACVDGFKCMVYENITDELYHFNGDDKHQLSFVRPSIKDYVEYKRKVFLTANSGNVVMEVDNSSKTEPVTSSVEGIRTIHDAIIEELWKLDDIRILKQTITIKEILELSGDAEITVLRSKRKHIYDFTCKCSITVTSNSQHVSDGEAVINDITADGEYELSTFSLTNKSINQSSIKGPFSKKVFELLKNLMKNSS